MSLTALLRALLKQTLVVLVVAIGYAVFFQFSEYWWLYPKYSTWFMPLGWVLGVLLIVPYVRWPAVALGIALSYTIILWSDTPYTIWGI